MPRADQAAIHLVTDYHFDAMEVTGFDRLGTS